MNDKAISAEREKGGCVLIGAGMVFFGAGAFFLWFVFISPLYQSIGSGSWPQADCEIQKSEVQVNRDTDGSSYKPIVEYEYTVDGQTYFGDSPTFEDISARRKWAKSIVEKYKVGDTAKCYYNPDDHGTSVLDPTFLWTFYAMALFPMAFALGGLTLLYFGIFGTKTSDQNPKNSVSGDSSSTASWFGGSAATAGQAGHAADILDQQWSVPKRLVRSESRWLGLVLMVVCAGLWNSFVGFFMFTEGGIGGGWFETLFMIPFVLVGLLLLVGLVYAFLAMFNPEVEIALSTGAVSPGETVDIAWEVKGNANRFRSLQIELRGRQTAIYRQGTDTYTDHETFELIPILDSGTIDEMQFGSAVVSIPAETMHTFDASNNKIQWHVVVRGDIPWWPDVREMFEFRVKPT